MSVSAALERSAREFSAKYVCKFDFNTFESSIEELTFLRPNNGWSDVYKMTFERAYMQALETVARESDLRLDGEAMLDDFEYTLIRPYVSECENEIRHRPYLGMDRVSRLEYLRHLTSLAPSNSVELYEEKYKNGELSVKQMLSILEHDGGSRDDCVKIAGCVQALENVNKGRSRLWRTLHPFKNSTEKRNSEQLKKAFIERTGGKENYSKATAEAYETFVGHQKVSESLEERMIHAREEMNRKQKMSDAVKENLLIEGFERESLREPSPRIEPYRVLLNKKQL